VQKKMTIALFFKTIAIFLLKIGSPESSGHNIVTRFETLSEMMKMVMEMFLNTTLDFRTALMMVTWGRFYETQFRPKSY
jgi:hypothetical protein